MEQAAKHSHSFVHGVGSRENSNHRRSFHNSHHRHGIFDSDHHRSGDSLTSVSSLTRDSSVRSDDHLMMDEMIDDNFVVGGGKYHRYHHFQQQQQHHHQQKKRQSSKGTLQHGKEHGKEIEENDEEGVLKMNIADLTNHLYGREDQQAMLQLAFVQVLKQQKDSGHSKTATNTTTSTTVTSTATKLNTVEVVLIHGRIGTGKTALYNDFREAVTSTGTGICCRGRFSPFGVAVSKVYDPMVYALADLCDGIIQGDPSGRQRREIRNWFTKQQQKMKNQRQVKLASPLFDWKAIFRLVPKIDTLLGGLLEEFLLDDESKNLHQHHQQYQGNTSNKDLNDRVVPKVNSLMGGSVVENEGNEGKKDDDKKDEDNEDNQASFSRRLSSFSAHSLQQHGTASPAWTLFKQILVIFRQMVHIICDSNHPVIFFLDDLQWADKDVMETIVTRLLQTIESPNFLFLAAYRDDDKGLSRTPFNVREMLQHPSISTSETTFSVTDMEVANLELENIKDMLSDITGATSAQTDETNQENEEDDIISTDEQAKDENDTNKQNDSILLSSSLQELATIVLAKTDGNPYSILQFLEMLQRQEFLTFSFHRQRWEWNLEQINAETSEQATQQRRNRGGHLLAGQIERLSENAQLVVHLASYLGIFFEGALIEQIFNAFKLFDRQWEQQIQVQQLQHLASDATKLASFRKQFYKEAVGSSLIEAETAELIVRRVTSTSVGNGTRPTMGAETGGGGGSASVRACSYVYAFSHEFLHQSLYELIPDGKERPMLHLRIGQVLKDVYTQMEHSDENVDRDDGLVLAAAVQFNLGSSCISNSKDDHKFVQDEDERQRIELVRWNLKASQMIYARGTTTSLTAAELLQKAIDLLLVEAPPSMQASSSNFGDAKNHKNNINNNDGNDVFENSKKQKKKNAKNGSTTSASVEDIENNSPSWNDYYELTLEVYNRSAEMEFASGCLDVALSRCQEVERYAKNFQDKLPTLLVQAEVFHAQGRLREAMRLCQEVLHELGEKSISARPNRAHTMVDLMKTKKSMKGYSTHAAAPTSSSKTNNASDAASPTVPFSSTPPSLIGLPIMMDESKIFSMRFLCLLAILGMYVVEDSLVQLVLLRMLRISIQHGLCDETPFAVAGYGMMASNLGNIDDAYNFGTLALAICDRLKQTQMDAGKRGDRCIPRAYLLIYMMLDHLKNPLLNSVERLSDAYRIASEHESVEFTISCMAASASAGFVCSIPLGTFKKDLKNMCEHTKRLKHMSGWRLIAPIWQAALNLAGGTGSGDDPRKLTGLAMDEDKFLYNVHSEQKSLSLINFFLIRMVIAYILNDVEEAHQMRKELRRYRLNDLAKSHFMINFHILFSGLVSTERHRLTGKRKCSREARQSLKQMERLVQNGMGNCRGMFSLLQAEVAAMAWTSRSKGEEDTTKRLFDDAISSFSSSGFMHLQAIASERAANYMFRSGKQCWFETYIRTSTKLYSEWGAMAKVQQLVSEYRLPPKFLTEQKDAPPMIMIHGRSNNGSSHSRLTHHGLPTRPEGRLSPIPTEHFDT